MYLKAIEVVKRHVFYRPMLPDARDVLLSGNVRIDHASGNPVLDAEGQHLACFVGGMVELASKIFDRPQDMDVGRRLVDGCVWAYSVTSTGIMPESFHAIPLPGCGSL